MYKTTESTERCSSAVSLSPPVVTFHHGAGGHGRRHTAPHNYEADAPSRGCSSHVPSADEQVEEDNEWESNSEWCSDHSSSICESSGFNSDNQAGGTHRNCGSKRRRPDAVFAVPKGAAPQSVSTSPKRRPTRRYTDASWVRMLALVVAYMAQHGGCNVPLSPRHVRS